MFKLAVFAASFLFAGPLLADSELLMAEQDGCYYCEKWDDEIAAIYPKTAEGRAAPLRRYDIHDGVPADAKLKSSAHFTPTFILMTDGVEVGRIEGYPGEDFFWALLEEMIKDAGIEVSG